VGAQKRKNHGTWSEHGEHDMTRKRVEAFVGGGTGDQKQTIKTAWVLIKGATVNYSLNPKKPTKDRISFRKSESRGVEFAQKQEIGRGGRLGGKS